MSEQAQQIHDDLRSRILSDPELVLEDPTLMKALIAANERSLGGNIVDLRGIAMERLESRLDRLEDTHRTVIAAAYENLAGNDRKSVVLGKSGDLGGRRIIKKKH